MTDTLLFANNASSILRVDTSSGSLSITLPSGEGAKFPTPGSGQSFMVTLEDRRSNQMEIVRCVQRTADVLTVTRAQESTTAQSFLAGATASLRITRGTLEYLQGIITGATGYDQVTSDARFVNVTGDAMTGAFTLFADPVATLQAATKQYVDTRILRAGDTMAGVLTLAADPVSALQAATKAYVDTRMLRAGDVMTGSLTLSGAPTVPLHAATKQYVDSQIASGGTFIDAPTDGVTYARLNGSWQAAPPEAPSDNSYYSRRNNAWAVAPPPIPDVASDGIYYARRNAAWVNIATVFATLVSPTFTGTPTAPTATPDTNTQQLATTGFVLAQASNGNPNGPGTAAPGTSPRYARTDHVHPRDASKADLASPVFGGTPTAPTALVDTNSLQLATTGFVLAQAASLTPIINGTGAVGTSTRFARGDHVHPTDTTRAPLVSPAFTVVPTAPTAGADTNTNQLATTGFVIGQVGTQAPLASAALAVVGTSLRYSRQDHVHPRDTTKADIASPSFTGTPLAPTASVGTSTFQIATTAFVINQGYAKVNAPTFTTGVTVNGNVLITGTAISFIGQNGVLEIGNPFAAGVAAFDGHTSGANIDYDQRILFSGGTGVTGQGAIDLIGATVTVNGSDIRTALNTPIQTYAASWLNGASSVTLGRQALMAPHLMGTWLIGTTYSYLDVVSFSQSQGAVANQGLFVSLVNGNVGHNPETVTSAWAPVFLVPVSIGAITGGGPP